MEGVYSFCEDMWYGYVEGVFVADSEDVDIICEAGVCVNFGEILGKHSEVSISFKRSDFKLISDDPTEVNILSKAQSGYNPFDQECFHFKMCEELNEALEKVESEYYTLGQFIEYIKKEGIWENIKNAQDNLKKED